MFIWNENVYFHYFENVYITVILYIYNILAFYYWIIIYFTIFIREFSIKLKKIEIFNLFRYTFLKRRSN